MIKEQYGVKRWFLNGKLHREDGPAVEWSDGSKLWFLNGKLHREDGPAIEYLGAGRRWYLDGEEFSRLDYLDEIKYRKELEIENKQIREENKLKT